jgi:hypothetical protein
MSLRIIATESGTGRWSAATSEAITPSATGARSEEKP